MHTIYLGLGSNLGDRLANLRAAVAAFPPRVHLLDGSPIYETPPWGYPDQPAFLNMVVRAQTRFSPLPLLTCLKQLESHLGRAPTFLYGPRQIDIDILFYDDLILDRPELIIPHPRLHARAFVLVPLADLAPDLLHPRLHKTIRQLLAEVDRSGITLFSPTLI